MNQKLDPLNRSHWNSSKEHAKPHECKATINQGSGFDSSPECW